MVWFTLNLVQMYTSGTGRFGELQGDCAEVGEKRMGEKQCFFSFQNMALDDRNPRDLDFNKIKKLDELAEMSVGELMDLSDKITETEASALIMEARKPWFE